jgi:ATP-dependent DNA helicase RecQ
MLDTMPTSPSEMLRINGVGDSKLEKYGGDFLDILRRYAEAS